MEEMSIKVEDLASLFRDLVDVTGRGCEGIIYRFGERMGSRYSTLAGKFPPEDRLKKALEALIPLGYFNKVEISFKEELISITLHNPFELATKQSRCNFMRGFLFGLTSGIYGDKRDIHYYYKERHDEGGKCAFTLANVKWTDVVKEVIK
jgi:predicted hydrocarbon binding protein